mgnify:CR=1 FL=1
MKWNNLKSNLCPSCGEDITTCFNVKTRMIECECGFKIGEAKMGAIVSDRVKKRIDDSYSGEELEIY